MKFMKTKTDTLQELLTAIVQEIASQQCFGDVTPLVKKLDDFLIAHRESQSTLEKIGKILEVADLCKVSKPHLWANAISKARVAIDASLSIPRKG